MNLDPLHIKQRIVDIAHSTGAGHVASALSCVEILCKIYTDAPDNVIILSKGHGALAQYVILNELGKLPDDVLDTYHQDGGLSEHATLAPEYGIFASTGSLGHGLGIGIGYALANPKQNVFVVLGDGELDEGSTYEAFKFILDNNITNIRPVVDINGWQGFRETTEYLPAFVKMFTTETIQPYFTHYNTNGKGEGFSTVDTLESHYTHVGDKEYNLWNKYAKRANKKST